MDKIQKIRNISSFVFAGITAFASIGIIMMWGLFSVLLVFCTPFIIASIALIVLYILNGIEKYKKDRIGFVIAILILNALYLCLFPSIYSDFNYYPIFSTDGYSFLSILRNAFIVFSQIFMLCSAIAEFGIEIYIFAKKKENENDSKYPEYCTFANENDYKQRKVMVYLTSIFCLMAAIFVFEYFTNGVGVIAAIPFLIVGFIQFFNAKSLSLGERKNCAIISLILNIYFSIFWLKTLVDAFVDETLIFQTLSCAISLAFPVIFIVYCSVLDFSSFFKYKISLKNSKLC